MIPYCMWGWGKGEGQKLINSWYFWIVYIWLDAESGIGKTRLQT